MADVARAKTQNAPAQDENRVQAFSHPGLSATEAAVECFKEYARERPEIVTMWAFGLGFVLGWKLRIW
jgi:ElaB/YqjD/DUF883 family membrane-anchored ribosome-binding protein